MDLLPIYLEKALIINELFGDMILLAYICSSDNLYSHIKYENNI